MLQRVALCYSVLQCVAEVAAKRAFSTLRQNNALGADVLCASLRRIICCSVLLCAIALLLCVAVCVVVCCSAQ